MVAGECEKYDPEEEERKRDQLEQEARVRRCSLVYDSLESTLPYDLLSHVIAPFVDGREEPPVRQSYCIIM